MAYITNGVFGVGPEGPIFERFLALVAERLDEAVELVDAEGDGDDPYQVAADLVIEDNPDLLLELQEQYQAPGAGIHRTGNFNDRPPHSGDIEPDYWLFGYGVFGLADQPAIREPFLGAARYYSWVTEV